MANTQVGVELVAEGTTGFLSSLQAAQGGLGNFSTALATMTTNMGGIATQSSALGSALATTLGIALYDVGKQIIGIGGQALDTVAKFERSTQSITAMYAVEMMRGTEVAQVTKGLTSLSAKEEKALRDKTLQYPLYKENVALASEALKKLKEQTGENTVQYEAATAKLQIAVNKMHDLGTEIDTLSNKAGKEVLGTKMVSAGDAITDVKEAFRAAQGPATAMIDDMTKLALISPFKREDTISTLKMAKGFGMTLEESGKLTTSLTKFATVTGRSGDHISRLAYAMGEMKSMDKVMMRQVRQMNLAGISVADMGEAFGITTKEMTDRIHDGSVKFDEFTGNMNKFIENKYGDAFKNIANSFVGLNNAVDDIKELGLAAIFEGPLKLYKPLLEAFVQPFTSGTLLESIRGFSIDLTKSFIPMFEDLAGGLTNVFARFETFASLIGGKGTVAVDKQETAMKDHQATIKGLGTSMTDLSKSGINMSDGFATLTLSSARVKASQDIVNTSLKENEETLKTLGTENGKLTAENSKYGDSMRKLAAAGKTNSDEFRALNTLVTDNKNKIGANKTEVDGLNKSNTELNKEGKSLSGTFDVLSGKMETATKKGEDKSKMYKDLVAQMDVEASTMGKNTDKYKEMAADLKVMDDNTKSYMDQIGKLTVAEAVAGEMSDQLKKLNEDNKTMPWADAFLKANEDIMPVGSSLHTIFKNIFEVIKKVADLFKSTSGTLTGAVTPAFNAFDAVLANVAKFVNDNFETIVVVIRNVVAALGGLFAVGAAMSTIKQIIIVIGLMLNPLNLVIAAVALLSVAWQKNWGDIQGATKPVIDFVKAQLQSIKDWFWGLRVDTDFAKEQFDKFYKGVEDVFGKLATVVTGVATWAGLIPIELDDTKLAASFTRVSLLDTQTLKDKFTPEALGLNKAIDGFESLFVKIGFAPKVIDGIADSMRVAAAKLGETFNLDAVVEKTGSSSPSFQAVQANVKGMFSVPWGSADAESLVSSWGGHIKTSITTMFGGNGFAESIGTAVSLAIEIVWTRINNLILVLTYLKDKFITVTEWIWLHREGFLNLVIALFQVYLAFTIVNGVVALFNGVGILPILAQMGAAMWTYAFTSVSAFLWKEGQELASIARTQLVMAANWLFQTSGLATLLATKASTTLAGLFWGNLETVGMETALVKKTALTWSDIALGAWALVKKVATWVMSLFLITTETLAIEGAMTARQNAQKRGALAQIFWTVWGWMASTAAFFGFSAANLIAGASYMVAMTAFLIGPWGIAIVIIILLIAAIIMNVDGLATGIMDLFMKIFGFMQDIVMTIVGSLIRIVGTLYYLLKDQVVDFYNNTVAPALDVVAEMFNALVTAVSYVIDILMGLWELFKLFILPILEIYVIGAISIVVSYFMLLFTAVWGIIRLFWMLVKWIWSLISSFLEWSGIIDGVKWVFNELVKFGKGPIVAGFFRGLLGLIGGIVKAFSLVRDGINSVIEGFAKAERARLGTTLLSDLDARDPNYESKKNAILEGEQMKRYTTNFEGVAKGPDFEKETAGASESRYTKTMEGGDLGDKPAEGGFLAGLFGTGKGKGMMDLLGGAGGASGMDTGAVESGTMPDFMKGLGGGMPGAASPPGTGGATGGYPANSVFMSEEQKEKANRSRENTAQANKAADLAGWAAFAKPKPREATTTINIDGSYIGSNTQAGYGVKSGTTTAAVLRKARENAGANG